MVDHQPAKFSGHNPCGSGDLIILVVERQDVLT